jgi:ring-1,2-phenylacetyl-CoA epoxidase subunit PaaE
LRIDKNGEDIRRSYSICTGLDDGELRVAIKKVEGGTFSTLCNDLFKPGDEIDVMTPQGRFGLAPDPAKARNYLAVVAGSGITPVLSLLRSILKREPKSRFALIYGNRSTPDIIFKEALEDLKDRFVDRFVVHHVLSREQQDFALFNGRIDGEKIGTLLKSFAAPSDIDHAFLCGPGGLIEEGKRALLGLGVPAERIHAEYFSTDGLPVTPRVAARQANRRSARDRGRACDFRRLGLRPADPCRRDHHRCGSARRARTAVLLPRRNVLHLPREARIRRGADGHQLFARAVGNAGRFRADLPITSAHA